MHPLCWTHSFVSAADRSYHQSLAIAKSQSATAGGIGIYWRPADYGRVAGRTTIAWCLAAVSLPVLAGTLFDMTRQYGTAVLMATGANVAGMAMALTRSAVALPSPFQVAAGYAPAHTSPFASPRRLSSTPRISPDPLPTGKPNSVSRR